MNPPGIGSHFEGKRAVILKVASLLLFCGDGFLKGLGKIQGQTGHP